jgi:hypothetical protein
MNRICVVKTTENEHEPIFQVRILVGKLIRGTDIQGPGYHTTR